MKFVIVTGMSGGGKSSAIRMLEDLGFYCVDNLPVQLIEKFAELVSIPSNDITKVALGIDARTDHYFQGAQAAIDKIRSEGCPVEILFMDAADDVLLRRFKETRRTHPLSGEGRIEDCIKAEREKLADVRKRADYVIDTSQMLTSELKQMMTDIFIKDKAYNSMLITILSFGFKYGIPVDSDLVFDVRFLPNPFYIEELKHQTGLNKPVQDYVLAAPQAHEFVDRVRDLLLFLIPGYIKEGKSRLVISIGCTGGHHRSVTIAGALYEAIKGGGDYRIKLAHRDYQK